MQSWCWKSRQRQDALEQKGCSSARETNKNKKVTSKLEQLYMNFRFASMIWVKKKKAGGKKVILVVFLGR